MTRLVIARPQLEETLLKLRAGGMRGEERMIAWLGKDTLTGEAKVREAYEPEQVCKKDQFYIPPAAMTALMQTLGRTRSKILAQIHTHPGTAFHSEADDAWAIIRHVGALSLVLPHFAKTTTTDNFLKQVKTYALSAESEWQLIPNSCLEIVQ